MIQLIAMRPPELISAYPGILDLQEVCGMAGGAEFIQLWVDASGRISGFSLLEGSV